MAQERKMGRVDSLQEQEAQLYDTLSPIVKVYIDTIYRLRDPRLTREEVEELHMGNLQRLQQICQDSRLSSNSSYSALSWRALHKQQIVREP